LTLQEQLTKMPHMYYKGCSFPRNPEATSKFYVPQRWQAASSTLTTHKYYALPHKI